SYGRPVGFVEGSLEYVRNLQLPANIHVMFGGSQGRVQVFQDIEATEENKWRLVANRDRLVDRERHGRGRRMHALMFQVWAGAFRCGVAYCAGVVGSSCEPVGKEILIMPLASAWCSFLELFFLTRIFTLP